MGINRGGEDQGPGACEVVVPPRCPAPPGEVGVYMRCSYCPVVHEENGKTLETGNIDNGHGDLGSFESFQK